MKSGFLALLALAMMGGATYAAAPNEAQKAEFYDVCVQRGAVELCTCKADAAMTLIDSEFMAVVIASMRGKPLDPKYAVAYNDYIVGSTRACGMGI